MNPKKKRVFAGLAAGICHISRREKTKIFESAIFYPAMLENEEANLITLPLHDLYNVRLDL